jgi:hypothetical protein
MTNSSPEPRTDLEALFTLARAHRPETSRAAYGFETRLMARLRARRRPDTASLFSLVTWRLLPFFAVCVIGLAVWQSEAASDSTEMALAAGLDNPVAGDLWGD